MQKFWFAWLLLLVTGCGSSTSPNATESQASTAPSENMGRRNKTYTDNSMSSAMILVPVPPIEDPQVTNSRLLAARLTPEQLEEGWIRLFDGYEMTGWYYVGNANWTFADGVLTVDGGEPSLFCTNFQISDFELMIDFNCSARTDSGILLRTPSDPTDMATDCYELNIAPPDSEYPTGSLVKRQKVDRQAIGEIEPDQWHTYRVVVQDDQVKGWLDGQPVIEYTDPGKLRSGFIALQHNLGVARFRNILMRPLGGRDLTLSEGWKENWKVLDNPGPSFKVDNSPEGLALRGGPGQLQSDEQWDDFVLQATFQVADTNVNSGILFRGLADRYNEAYECQIYDGPISAGTDKSKPRLQTGALNIPIKNEATNVRVVASETGSPTHLTIVADEGQFCAYVNGILVSDVADTRDISVNPQVGFRREAGKIALQAADENCDVTFQRIHVTPIRRR